MVWYLPIIEETSNIHGETYYRCINLDNRKTVTMPAMETLLAVSEQTPIVTQAELKSGVVVLAYDADTQEVLIYSRSNKEQIQGYSIDNLKGYIQTVKSAVYWRTPEMDEFAVQDEIRDSRTFVHPDSTIMIEGHKLIKYRRLPKDLTDNVLSELEKTIIKATALGVNGGALCTQLTKTMGKQLDIAEYAVNKYDYAAMWRRLGLLLVKYSWQTIQVTQDLQFMPLHTAARAGVPTAVGIRSDNFQAQANFMFTYIVPPFDKYDFTASINQNGLRGRKAADVFFDLAIDRGINTLQITGQFEHIFFSEKIEVESTIIVQKSLCSYLDFSNIAVGDKIFIKINAPRYLTTIKLPAAKKAQLMIISSETKPLVYTSTGKQVFVRYQENEAGFCNCTEEIQTE